MRLKALVIQGGEIPPPVKPNQQPVLSLGVEAVRSDLSVDKGVCEPQCESVKPISPVNFGNAEVETVPEVADSNGQAVNGKECLGSAVVNGRGEHMKGN